MKPHPQTIQIFLPTGDPQGIRVAEITTRIVRVIEVPRSDLAEFLAAPESEQVGVYFLFGEDEASGRPMTYIGQTGSLRTRLAQHNAHKDFWNRAVIALSLTNSLTNTHASFLEWLSIQKAQKAARYVLENGNAGGRPHTPPPLLADCTEIHETIRVLLATLGYPLFEAVARRALEPIVAEGAVLHEQPEPMPTELEARRLYFCAGREAEARGIYTNEGFVVLAGSTARAEAVSSFQPTGYYRQREQLIQEGALAAEGARLRFVRDTLFKSPSAAAACVLGRTANGPLEWRDANSVTLWEHEMKPLEAAAEARTSIDVSV
ncbi:GIY-YIG nuclease family protein [Lysobacter sp. HA18]